MGFEEYPSHTRDQTRWRMRRERPLITPEGAIEVDSPETAEARREMREEVDHAMRAAGLARWERVVWVLIQGYEFSQDEAAGVLGCPRTSVRQWYRDAQAKMDVYRVSEEGQRERGA